MVVPNHSFLRITPDNPEDFSGDFTKTFTLGGYTDGNFLIKGINAPNDYSEKMNIRAEGVISTPNGMTDTQFINTLTSNFDSYNDDVNYNMWGTFTLGKVKGYNSNNFATEIIESSGGSLENFSDGWGIDPGLGARFKKEQQLDNNNSNNIEKDIQKTDIDNKKKEKSKSSSK